MVRSAKSTMRLVSRRKLRPETFIVFDLKITDRGPPLPVTEVVIGCRCVASNAVLSAPLSIAFNSVFSTARSAV